MHWELASAEAELRGIRRAVAVNGSTPYSLLDVLRILCDVADHALDTHSCDHHGHEAWSEARHAGRECIRELTRLAAEGGPLEAPLERDQQQGAPRPSADRVSVTPALLTPERRAEIRARLAATPRRRLLAADPDFPDTPKVITETHESVAIVSDLGWAPECECAWAELFAHAPTDLADLLAEVDRLTARVAELEQAQAAHDLTDHALGALRGVLALGAFHSVHPYDVEEVIVALNDCTPGDFDLLRAYAARWRAEVAKAGRARAGDVARIVRWLVRRVEAAEKARTGDVARIVGWLRKQHDCLYYDSPLRIAYARAIAGIEDGDWRDQPADPRSSAEAEKARAGDVARIVGWLRDEATSGFVSLRIGDACAAEKFADAIERGDWRDAPLPLDPRDARIAAPEVAGLLAVADTVVGPSTVYVYGAFNGGGHRLRDGGAIASEIRPLFEGACDAVADTPREHQTEGARTVRAQPFLPGWSFVSWWDRQGDKRYNSHTGILAEGTWTDAELIAAGRRLVPWAFRVEVADAR